MQKKVDCKFCLETEESKYNFSWTLHLFYPAFNDVDIILLLCDVVNMCLLFSATKAKEHYFYFHFCWKNAIYFHVVF